MKNRLKRIKDKPMPKKEDVEISMEMERHFGFRPFGMDW
jgi:hypothetical protein